MAEEKPTVAASSKTCTSCGVTKELEAFIRRTDRPGSYQSRCKACAAEYSRSWYARDSAKRSAKARAWYASNDDRAKENSARWKRQNRDRVWDSKARRRARMTGAKINPTSLAQRMAIFGSKCWMCGQPADSVDHVKPIAAGGQHILANLRPACLSCNSRKGAKWYGVANLALFRTN